MLAAFVGYKAAGISGAVVSACAIFLPAFILMLSILPVMARFRKVLWLKAAMRAIGAAVIGALTVSLLKLVPHAAPDAFTFALLVLTVLAMVLARVGPLSLILFGALAGMAARLKVLERLRDVA